MKKHFLLLFAIMMAVCSYGQTWMKKGNLERVPSKATFTVNKATITPEEGQVWWGYMSETDLSTTNGIGIGSANIPFLAAIYVPANHDIIGSGKVKAVRVYVQDGLGKTMKNVSVWISANKPATLAAADYVQSVASLTDGANDIALDTPFDINGQAFYIGYAVTSSNAYPIMCCGNESAPNTLLLSAPGRMGWIDAYNEGYDFGKLAFQILVDGVSLPSYNVSVEDFGTAYVVKGGTTTIPVTISNNGEETVNSISYIITTGSNTTEEKTISVSGLQSLAKGKVDIEFAADADTKKLDKTLTITKVNGEANESANNTAHGALITMTEVLPNVPVVEEFTGTWCGWCPVGFEGLQYIHDTYGEQVVLIAVHNDDPMAISDYNSIVNRVDGFPSSFINRTMDLYPHPYNFQIYMPEVLASTTLGGISVQAAWNSEDMKTIKIDTQTKFVYTHDNGNYGIAFVLVEDGLKGTGSSWAQANNLSGNSDYRDFKFWYESPSRVTGLEFDHVAVGAWNIANGFANSVNTTIVADEIQDYSYTADISSKSVIQDKTKLKVVALLIDKSNGSIINAAQTTIDDYTTGINDANVDNVVETARYNLNGHKINAPQHGVNIIRMSDGSVKKVVVK